MILIINICKEKFHYYEFVKPVEDILKNKGVKFFTKNYRDVAENDLKKAEKIIICGTSLKDFEYFNNLNKFAWLKTFEKPVLGICAGMQIIGLVYGGKMKRKTEIGFFIEDFREEFLGTIGKHEVYHLHNNFIDFKRLKEFKIVCFGDSVSQAVKYKNMYGVLFHPEVRNKKLIEEFCNGKFN